MKSQTLVKALVAVGGTISLLNLLWYAYGTWCGDITPTSTATWLMWTVLDAILFAAAVAKRQGVVLPLSYVVGATAVLTAHLLVGTWHWTYIETISMVGASLAIGLWWKLKEPDLATISCVAAMSIAGVPLMFQFWYTPVPAAFWVFANTVVACALMLAAVWYGSRRFTVANSLLAWGGFVFNGLYALMVIR